MRGRVGAWSGERHVGHGTYGTMWTLTRSLGYSIGVRSCGARSRSVLYSLAFLECVLFSLCRLLLSVSRISKCLLAGQNLQGLCPSKQQALPTVGSTRGGASSLSMWCTRTRNMCCRPSHRRRRKRWTWQLLRKDYYFNLRTKKCEMSLPHYRCH